MRKIRALLAAWIMVCGLLVAGIFIPSAEAAEAGLPALTAQVTGVRAGQEVALILSLPGQGEQKTGINAVKGTLVYDPEVFEPPAQEDLTVLDGWDSVTYNPGNGQFAVISRTGRPEGGQMLRLTLTAKEDLTGQATSVKISGLAASAGERDLSFDDVSVTLSAIGQQSPAGQGGDAADGQAQNGSSAGAADGAEEPETAPAPSQGADQEQPGQADREENPAGQDQPEEEQPGKGTRIPGLAVFGLCAGLALLALIVLAVFWRNRDRTGGMKLLAGALLLTAAAALAAGSAYALGGRGDLNGDGAVDYTDVHMLKGHLIDLERLATDRQSRADMDLDGQLTVTDLSLLIWKIEKKLDYQVELTSAMDRFYYEKGEEVELRFSAHVSHGGQISYVTVDGRTYEVEREEDGALYTVRLDAGDAPGVRTLRLTGATLANGQEVATELTEQIEVLKDAPSITDFLAEEDDGRMKVSFSLWDEDSALTGAEMEVLEHVDGELAAVDRKDVTVGDNVFSLDLEEETTYTLSISARYDRASGALAAAGDHTGSLALVKEIRLSIDYQFTFGGLRTQTEDGTQTDRFHRGQPVVLWFASENNTRFEPERAVVSGKTYDVQPSGDGYIVKLPGFDHPGQAEICVEQIVLENGRAFGLTRDNALTVQILKELPEVTDFSVREEAKNSQIQISFRLTDPDGAVSNGAISIRNAAGQTVGQRAFGMDELADGVFRAAVPLTDTGVTSAYTVQIAADRDLSADGSEQERQVVLAEETVQAAPRAVIKAGDAQDTYVEQGGPVELTYGIAHNVDAELTHLVVDHRELAAERGQDGTWQVTAIAPETAGRHDFTLSQLVFDNGTTIDVSRTVEVEVMKSAPAAVDYEIRDDLAKEQVTFLFQLADPDRAFLSGKVRLITGDGGVVAEEAIGQPGEQAFTLDVEEQKEYTFQVLATWSKTEDGTRKVTDDVILEMPVCLVRDYGLALSELGTFLEDGTPAAYFEPGSPVTLRFRAETATTLAADRAQVNGRWYDLTALGGGRYELSLTAPGIAGAETLTIERLTLENGKELSAGRDNAIQIEVLKAVPEVEGFAWEQTDGDELKVRFTLSDPDGALLGGQLTIAQGDTVLLAQPLVPGENEGAAALTWREDYTVKVTADYDRDSDALDGNSNRYEAQTLFVTELTAARDGIQFKKVTAHRLYQSGSSGVREVDILDVTPGLPGDVESYYAVVEMAGLPDFYAGVREFRRDGDGRVYAVLDVEDAVLYSGDGTRRGEYSFAVPYRDESGDHPLVTSAEELFRQMAADPKGSYRLSEDLDASGLSDAAAAVAGTFTGELDGNGYKILNLPTSLFHTLSGAYIHDLVIENAQITTSRTGILANTIQNGAVVERVFLVDSSISNGVDGLGAFAGSLNNAAIRESASIGVSVKGLVAVGGIVGQTRAGAVIENCYVTGRVQGTYDHPSLGARVGGIAGWHGGGTIRACYTQVQVVAPARKGNGGLIGGPNTGSPVIENSLSMSSGAGYRIAGFDVLDSVTNVFEYSGSGSVSNITQTNREQVKETDAIFDREFYVDALGWDEAVWDLDLLAYGKRPSLTAAPETDNNYSIPDYVQVQSQPGYRPDRERVYANLAALMPFSDVRTWVDYGNALGEDSPLVTRTVAFVLPLDGANALVTGLYRDKPDAIEKIRIVFEDAGMVEYPVSWQKTMGDVVAVYRVEELDLPYQFHRYVGAVDESLLAEAVALVTGLDYASHIAVLTDETESRLYVDYYNETVRPKLETVAERALLSLEGYPTYCENEAVRALVRQRMLEEEGWKQLLYAYNYYDKWYRIDYRGVSLSDLMFFSGELLSEGMTARALTDKLLSAPAAQRETHRTAEFYNSVLKDYTGAGLTEFLGGLARSVAGYSDPSDWFAANFDGILKEQAPLYNADKLKYRIWDILSGLDDGRKSIVLAILTAPQEDMYLISMPSQVMIGSLNRYEAYIKKDGGERQRMEAVIDAYAEKMGIFYGVSSTWTDNSAEILNSFVNIQYDTRLNFPASAAADAGDQDKDKTRDPVMKWVFEANNTISIKNGSAAVANGTNVYWVLTPALGTSDYVFFTFSHETAHNQDGRYFYGGAGRRSGTGAEAHADGNIAQEYRDGVMVFNISRSLDIGTEMPNNFSYERINSPEKLWSYYREMFETGYVLDYLAAQAFLRLEPEEQAAVAVQAVHTPGGTDSFSTTYRALTAEELRQMDLRDLDDLWEERISIRGSLETVGTATEGSYGFESFYFMNWYQSHNDSGSPDTHSFKRLGLEMLGVGGFEAYQIYMSARSENDLDALRQITGREDITWEDYKLGRYQQVANDLDRIPWFDAESVIQQFQAAFERDARNGTRSEGIAVKRMLYGIVKRATGDFSDSGIYQSPAVITVTTAEDLVRLTAENPYGYYRLEEDLDFTGIAVSGGSYIPGRFIGVLDGNGHKLTGMEHPLFGDLQYAKVTDLTIEAPVFASSAQAMLAVKARQTVVGDVTVRGLTAEDAVRQLPLVKTKSSTYYEYGTAVVTAEEMGPAAPEVPDGGAEVPEGEVHPEGGQGGGGGTPTPDQETDAPAETEQPQLPEHSPETGDEAYAPEQPEAEKGNHLTVVLAKAVRSQALFRAWRILRNR